MANTLKVEVVNEDVLTHAVNNGIDYSNVLSTIRWDASNKSYTALQDCFAKLYIRGSANGLGDTSLNIGGNSILRIMATANNDFVHSAFIPVRKGQTVTLAFGGYFNEGYVTYYGVKR